MKTNQPTKLKTTPRSSGATIFSCGFFRHCTQTALSPTTTNPPQPAPAGQPPGLKPESSSSSTSSSSTTSQSFTQWKFPLPNNPHPVREGEGKGSPELIPGMITYGSLEELFDAAEAQFASGSGEDRLGAVQLLERSLVPLEGGEAAVCPAVIMRGVVGCLRDRVGARPASKVLLALCLAEDNRVVGVEEGAVGVVVEGLGDMESAPAERALASLDLLCTVPQGAWEVRSHALSVPMMVQVMGRMEGRGKEYALSVLGVIYGSSGDGLPPPQEVARAVMLALQGDCSERAKRKGAHLLKNLHQNANSDFSQQDKLGL